VLGQGRRRAVLQRVPCGDDAAAPVVPVAAFQYAEPGSGPALHRPPPALAEHTGEVLREIGYDDGELAQLHEAGVIKMETGGATGETA